MLEITDRHKDNVIYVCGSSPNIHNLSKEVLENNITIGINDFGKFYPYINYLICYDSCNLRDVKGFVGYVSGLQAEKYFKKDPKIIELFYNRPDIVNHWFRDKPALVADVNKEWDGTLNHIGSTCVAASHLAYIFGASKIILYGVDLCYGERFDGSKYANDNYWDLFRDRIVKALKRIPVPIYKTNLDSPLPFPYFEVC